MANIKWFHPVDRVSVSVMRHGSKNAEFYLHMSEKDIKRLANFGKKKQVKLAAGGSMRWTGPFRILSTSYGKKKKASTKPKPAPPIPRTTTRTTTRAKPKAKSKKKRKLSAYNIFVKKHRLAGKSMEQIGAMWRKKKR